MLISTRKFRRFEYNYYFGIRFSNALIPPHIQAGRNYKICITAIAVTALLCNYTQTFASDTTDVRISRTALYLQLSGKGNERSINFERVFRRGKKWNYSYGAGFSLFHKHLSAPFSFNAITTAPRHHLELSLGIIPHMKKHATGVIKDKYDKDKQLFIKPAIGYRYQTTGSGFFLKAGIGPQLFIDPPSGNIWNFKPRLIRPSAHIAAGFSF